MKERPILYSSEMVRAILDGRKTMTRRPIKFQGIAKVWRLGSGWICSTVFDDKQYGLDCPYGQSGDRLWVRETWRLEMNSGFYDIRFKADNYLWDCGTLYQQLKNLKCWIWRPSIHMPRWASRIILEIVDVKVERLQDIRAWEDVLKEGIQLDWYEHDGNEIELIDEFHKYWDSLYIKKPEYQWQANPWVWCLSFKRI